MPASCQAMAVVVVTTMNGAKAEQWTRPHDMQTSRLALCRLRICFQSTSDPRTTSGDTSCRIHTKCFGQHVLLKMHHVPFRFTAATETVEEEEMGMSRVRVVSLIPFTSYQVRTAENYHLKT